MTYSNVNYIQPKLKLILFETSMIMVTIHINTENNL